MRAGAHHAMPRHPFHLAMVLLIQPGLQTRLFQAEIGIANADLLKAKRSSPLFYIQSKLLKIERV